MHSEQFDVLWSIESISHYQNIAEFFASASRLLKTGRPFAITDFFQKENLTREATRKFIDPSKRACSWNYQRWMTTNNFHIERACKSCTAKV